MSKIVKSIEIAKNTLMPIMGMGTWEMRDKTVLENVLDAGFAAGYRLIDTGYIYQNEEHIGAILKNLLPKHNIKRSDVFITSKMPMTHHGTKVREAYNISLSKLQSDQIDLYLVHFPGAANVKPSDGERLKDLRRQTWTEMEKLYEEGKVKAIGVSNYMVKHLQEFDDYAKVKPAVDQCEFHPHNACPDLLDYCNKHGIHFQAYSSLGSPRSRQALFKEPLVLELCRKYDCQPAQLLLAWALNQNVSVLPKTVNLDHVKSNAEAANISMQKSDIDLLGKLKTAKRYCWDPTAVA